MCGILGYYGTPITINYFNTFLKRLKHRGQDGFGIHYCTDDGDFVTMHNAIINSETGSKNLTGHTLYTTSSKSSPVSQPITSQNQFGEYAMVFNGNIITPDETSDTKMLIDYMNEMSRKTTNWHELLKKLIKEYSQSFSIIIQTEDSMYAAKDKYGNRPLFCMHNHNSCLFSSETVILDSEEQRHYNIREIAKGEIYSMQECGGLRVAANIHSNCASHCLFEYIYFSHKNSSFDNVGISNYRENIGKLMAKQETFAGDGYIVCGVPNTGNHYAKAYASATGIPFRNYVQKNKDVSRTFILKNDEERNKFAKLKYKIDSRISGERVILIDDSLVRGITLMNLIKTLYDHGAQEVHIRIMSPPIVNTCEYGIDIPTVDELIYPNVNNIKEHLGCDSLKYLNLKECLSVFNNPRDKCSKCMDQKATYDW